MAATYSKPTAIPRWADTSGNVTEPPSGKKDEGWIVDDVPPSSYENWRTREIGRWFKWLDERLFDGGTEDSFAIDYPVDGSRAILFGDNLHVEVDCLEFWLTTKSGSALNGSIINFWNANRTGSGRRWRLLHYGNGLKITSYDDASVLEAEHVFIFADAGKSKWVFDGDAWLYPNSATSVIDSRLGTDADRWDFVHCEQLDTDNQTGDYAVIVKGKQTPGAGDKAALWIVQQDNDPAAYDNGAVWTTLEGIFTRYEDKTHSLIPTWCRVEIASGVENFKYENNISTVAVTGGGTTLRFNFSKIFSGDNKYSAVATCEDISQVDVFAIIKAQTSTYVDIGIYDTSTALAVNFNSTTQRVNLIVQGIDFL